jgi:hypothetical protein
MEEKGKFAYLLNHMVIRNEGSATIADLEPRRQRLSIVFLSAVKQYMRRPYTKGMYYIRIFTPLPWSCPV